MRNGFSSHDRPLLVCSVLVGPQVFPNLCLFFPYSWLPQIFVPRSIEIDLQFDTVSGHAVRIYQRRPKKGHPH
jgi:hypothetical protein